MIQRPPTPSVGDMVPVHEYVIRITYSESADGTVERTHSEEFSTMAEAERVVEQLLVGGSATRVRVWFMRSEYERHVCALQTR